MNIDDGKTRRWREQSVCPLVKKRRANILASCKVRRPQAGAPSFDASVTASLRAIG
jgi:hypothetical protein